MMRLLLTRNGPNVENLSVFTSRFTSGFPGGRGILFAKRRLRLSDNYF